MAIRILIADEYTVVRQGLWMFLVLDELGVQNRTKAALYAAQSGLVPLASA
jgi:hypothetical protein